jgi:DNA-binding NtrC family response regulator
MQEQKHLMIVDDEQEMGDLLGEFLRQEGYCVTIFSSPQAALEKINHDKCFPKVDMVISDIRMPGMDGFEFMDCLEQSDCQMPFIFITAFASPDFALEAVRHHAMDFIPKPFKLKEVKEKIENAFEFVRHRLKGRPAHNYLLEHILGKSKAMQTLFGVIGRVASSNANVLITGESGTGKEMVARAIHNMGPRRSKPFAVVDCTCIPESLLESELFGHAKGSFTGAGNKKRGLLEEADGGTIFFDEIGDLTLHLQAKLLRFLQERTVRAVGETHYRKINVRILAATHKNLKEMIECGAFREDLFFRISVVPISLPPLRERREDIPLLVNHFLSKYGTENQMKVKGFEQEAMDVLISAPWPGNVRELQNMIERAVVLSDGGVIGKEHLQGLSEADCSDSLFDSLIDDLPTLSALEDRYIKMILEKTGFRKERAAKILGIHRRTLYRKEQEFATLNGIINERKPV